MEKINTDCKKRLETFKANFLGEKTVTFYIVKIKVTLRVC